MAAGGDLMLRMGIDFTKANKGLDDFASRVARVAAGVASRREIDIETSRATAELLEASRAADRLHDSAARKIRPEVDASAIQQAAADVATSFEATRRSLADYVAQQRNAISQVVNAGRGGSSDNAEFVASARRGVAELKRLEEAAAQTERKIEEPITVHVDTTRAKAELNALEKQQGDSSSGGGAAGLLGGIKGIATGVGIAGLVAGLGSIAVKMKDGNAELERYQTQLGTLMGSTDAAKDRLAELARFGAETPFELPELVRAEKVLIGFGLQGERALKLTGKSAVELRTVIGDVAAGVGVPFEELALTMGKFSSGATGEAISRLQELGIVTKEQLRDVGIQFDKAGSLVSPLPQALTAAVTIMQDKFGGGMKDLSATFEGQLSTLKDTATQSLNTLGAPLFDVAKKGLGEINKVLSGPEFQKAIGTVGNLLSSVVGSLTNTLAGLVGPLVSLLEPIASAATTILQPIISTLGVVVNMAGGLISSVAGPLGILLASLASVLASVLTPALKLVTSVLGPIISIGGSVIAVVANLLAAVLPLVQIALIPLTVVLQVVGSLLTAILTPWANVIQKVSEFVGQVVGSLQPALGSITQIFTSFADLLGGAVGNALSSVVGAFFDLYSAIADSLAQMFGFSDATDLLRTALASVKSALSGVTSLIETLKFALEGAKSAIDAIKTGVKEFVAAVLSGDFSKAWDIISSFSDRVGGAAEKGFRNAEESAQNAKSFATAFANILKGLDAEIEIFQKKVNEGKLRPNTAEWRAEIDRIAEYRNRKLKEFATFFKVADITSETEQIKSKIDQLRKYTGSGPTVKPEVDATTATKQLKSALQEIADQIRKFNSQTSLLLTPDKYERDRLSLLQQQDEELLKVRRQREEIEKGEYEAKGAHYQRLNELESSIKSFYAAKLGELDKSLADERLKNLLKLQADQTRALIDASKDAESAISDEAVDAASARAEERVKQLRLQLQTDLRATLSENAEFQRRFNEAIKGARTPEEEGQILDSLVAEYATRLPELRNLVNRELREEAKIRREAADADAEAALQRRLSGITDEAEREREIRLAEARKTRDRELREVRGNAELEFRVRSRYAAMAYDLQDTYLRKTTLAYMGSFALREGFASAFTAKLSEEQRKKLSDEVTTLDKSEEQELARLQRGEISYLEYSNRLNEITTRRQQLQEELASSEINLWTGMLDGLRNAFQIFHDEQTRKMGETTSRLAGLVKAGELSSRQFFEGQMSLLQDGALAAGAAIGSVLIESITQSKSAMEGLKKAVLTTLFEMAESQVLIFTPTIIGAATSLLGPIAGPIAGGLAVATLKGLLSTAKGALKLEKGMVDIPGDKSKGDYIPIIGAAGESMITRAATATNRDALVWMNKNPGRRIEEWIIAKHGKLLAGSRQQIATQEDVTRAIGRLERTITERMQSLETTFASEFESHHGIEIEFGELRQNGADLAATVAYHQSRSLKTGY